MYYFVLNVCFLNFYLIFLSIILLVTYFLLTFAKYSDNIRILLRILFANL